MLWNLEALYLDPSLVYIPGSERHQQRPYIYRPIPEGILMGLLVRRRLLALYTAEDFLVLRTVERCFCFFFLCAPIH